MSIAGATCPQWATCQSNLTSSVFVQCTGPESGKRGSYIWGENVNTVSARSIMGHECAGQPSSIRFQQDPADVGIWLCTSHTKLMDSRSFVGLSLMMRTDSYMATGNNSSTVIHPDQIRICCGIICGNHDPPSPDPPKSSR